MLVPTRERPANFRRFVESVISTASHPDRIEVHCYIDQDAAELDAYMAIIEDLEKSDGVTFGGGVGNPVGVPGAMNQLGIACKTDLLMVSNDDQVYITKEWDIRLDEEAAKFPDGIFVFWFNDRLQSERTCCFPILSQKWGELLLYCSPTMMEHFYCDTWLMDVAARIGRAVYIPDIFVEHIAAWAGLAPQDATAERTRGPLYEGRINRDELTYRRLARYRDVDADILRKAIEPSTYEIATGRIAGAPLERPTIDPETGTIHIHFESNNAYSTNFRTLVAP